MKKDIHFQLLSVLVAIVAIAPGAAAAERVVAVGDVHGSYDGLVAILQHSQLIDADTHWIGGETTLVQTGDLLDRGLQIREVMDLLIRLQEEAAAVGGNVIVLLGNHEAMNLIGFYRDVNPDVYASFADDTSEKRRKNGYRNFKKYWLVRAAASGEGTPEFTGEVKAQWMETYPPGHIEYTEALGPDGVYGKWLRTLPVAVMLDGVLFVHGGIGPELSGLTIDQINRDVADEISAYDTARAYMVEKHLVPVTANLNVMLDAYLRQDSKDTRRPPDPDSKASSVHMPGFRKPPKARCGFAGPQNGMRQPAARRWHSCSTGWALDTSSAGTASRETRTSPADLAAGSF